MDSPSGTPPELLPTVTTDLDPPAADPPAENRSIADAPAVEGPGTEASALDQPLSESTSAPVTATEPFQAPEYVPVVDPLPAIASSHPPAPEIAPEGSDVVELPSMIVSPSTATESSTLPASDTVLGSDPPAPVEPSSGMEQRLAPNPLIESSTVDPVLVVCQIAESHVSECVPTGADSDPMSGVRTSSTIMYPPVEPPMDVSTPPAIEATSVVSERVASQPEIVDFSNPVPRIELVEVQTICPEHAIGSPQVVVTNHKGDAVIVSEQETEDIVPSVATNQPATATPVPPPAAPKADTSKSEAANGSHKTPLKGKSSLASLKSLLKSKPKAKPSQDTPKKPNLRERMHNLIKLEPAAPKKHIVVKKVDTFRQARGITRGRSKNISAQNHSARAVAADRPNAFEQRRPPARAIHTASAAPVRRDTHVVVIDPMVQKSRGRRAKDKVRRGFIRIGGRHVLHLMLGRPGANVATAVVGQY